MPTQGRTPSSPQGQRKPTINDVARAAGVSKKTVSRVINKSPLVKAETRAKVDAAIVDLGFSPDPLARALAMRRSRSA
jgi:LacI family transcriptional regulator